VQLHAHIAACLRATPQRCELATLVRERCDTTGVPRTWVNPNCALSCSWHSNHVATPLRIRLLPDPVSTMPLAESASESSGGRLMRSRAAEPPFRRGATAHTLGAFAGRRGQRHCAPRSWGRHVPPTRPRAPHAGHGAGRGARWHEQGARPLPRRRKTNLRTIGGTYRARICPVIVNPRANLYINTHLTINAPCSKSESTHAARIGDGSILSSRETGTWCRARSPCLWARPSDSRDSSQLSSAKPHHSPPAQAQRDHLPDTCSANPHSPPIPRAGRSELDNGYHLKILAGRVALQKGLAQLQTEMMQQLEERKALHAKLMKKLGEETNKAPGQVLPPFQAPQPDAATPAPPAPYRLLHRTK
jgi:hypothetical protein